MEGRLLIHRGFTGHACRPHEKSGIAGGFAFLEDEGDFPALAVEADGGTDADLADEVKENTAVECNQESDKEPVVGIDKVN